MLLAKLDGIELPPQFSYRPSVARKRVSIIPTANAVVVQSGTPAIIEGEDVISFTCEAMKPSEFQVLYDLYGDITDPPMLFEGYWGDTYTVLFSQLDSPQVRGRTFSGSGSFQVLCTVTPMNAGCNE